MKKWISLNLCSLLCICNLPAQTSAEYLKQTADLKQTVALYLPSLYGWCTPEKASNFIDLVLEVRPQLCVEIGVFGGSSLYPVASALKLLGDGMVIGIDPWDRVECIKYYDPKEDEAHLNWWGKVNLEQVYNSYLTMLKMHSIEDQCTTIKATSEKAAALITTPIDILYIDGNHNEEISCKDVRLYLPKVRSGGYIWLNDTLSTDLQPAIDLLLEKCDVIKLIDNGNCILFKKR